MSRAAWRAPRKRWPGWPGTSSSLQGDGRHEPAVLAAQDPQTDALPVGADDEPESSNRLSRSSTFESRKMPSAGDPIMVATTRKVPMVSSAVRLGGAAAAPVASATTVATLVPSTKVADGDGSGAAKRMVWPATGLP